MDSDGLQAYQVTWVYPITNFAAQTKVNVCTGEKFVNVRFVALSSVGSSVWLDGNTVGVLGPGSMDIDVPLGFHKMSIVHPERGKIWEREVQYADSSPGVDRFEIDAGR
jgi:hypothetical protein